MGSYGNPRYIAADEVKECLNWDFNKTTLISIGTGREPHSPRARPGAPFAGLAVDRPGAGRLHAVRLRSSGASGENLFPAAGFPALPDKPERKDRLDDTSQMERLLAYGSRLSRMIINDQMDPSQEMVVKLLTYFGVLDS